MYALSTRKSYVRPFSSAETAQLTRSFRAGAPFAHIIIDDFLAVGGAALRDDFPDLDWPHWKTFVDEYQKEKRFCNDLSAIPEKLRDLIIECQQPAFLAFLEKITGCKMLTVDPYLYGGGLHCSGPGGILAPHTDFHYHDELGLYRMLNLLIYLNEDWSLADGGYLELYRKGVAQPEMTTAPALGKAVLFRTDDSSVHGFATPVGSGKWRKSIALYYYSARDVAGYAGDSSTHWQTHGARLTGPRLLAYDALMLASRGLSRLARIINPNF